MRCRSTRVETREVWSAARKRLLEREQELGNLDEEVAKQRKELPWVEEQMATGELAKMVAEADAWPYYSLLLDQVPDGPGRLLPAAPP
jgi:predicted  nucleic acid-binding Zn-ribbon protein